MTEFEKAKEIEQLKERLKLYYQREKEMLDGGVQSYGIGTRNVSRYQTDLTAIRTAIKDIKNEIEELENKSKRKAVGVVPRDW